MKSCENHCSHITRPLHGLGIVQTGLGLKVKPLLNNSGQTTGPGPKFSRLGQDAYF